MKNRNGFSLIELLAGLVSAAMVLMLISLLMFMPYRTLRMNRSLEQMRRDAVIAMQMMSRDIRSSSQNGINASQDSLQIGSTAMHPIAVEYRRDAGTGTLIYDDGAQSETLIRSGVQRFNPAVTNDLVSGISGVVLELWLTEPDSEITLYEKMFIHTRN